MKKEDFERIRQKEGDYRTGEYKGLKWEVKRHPTLLHLCGYVTLPKDASGFEFLKQECTYSEKDDEDNIVLGFDCAHYGMIVPGYLYMPNPNMFDEILKPGNIYWNMEMCINTIHRSIDNYLN